MTEFETVQVLRYAIVQTAERLGIADAGYRDSKELLGAIRDADNITSRTLQEFLNAYVEWFRLAKRNEELGKTDLDPGDQNEFVRRVANRNAKRDEHLRRIGQLQNE